jgi:hypothetical protein
VGWKLLVPAPKKKPPGSGVVPLAFQVVWLTSVASCGEPIWKVMVAPACTVIRFGLKEKPDWLMVCALAVSEEVRRTMAESRCMDLGLV